MKFEVVVESNVGKDNNIKKTIKFVYLSGIMGSSFEVLMQS